MYTPSVLTKFHLFENSLGGSSNFGTRLNMVVWRQKWPFSYDTFLKIFPTNYFKNFLPTCSICVLYTHQVHVFENSVAGVSRSSNGYPTSNEEHEPFVVYETFLKNFPTNFF